jgi:hypothetical protein
MFVLGGRRAYIPPVKRKLLRRRGERQARRNAEHLRRARGAGGRKTAPDPVGCRLRRLTGSRSAGPAGFPGTPARFRLVTAKDSPVRERRIAWIQQNRIGLSFIATPQGTAAS